MQSTHRFNVLQYAFSHHYQGNFLPLHYGEVAMGSWKWEFFIFEREIYLEYLDTDKMGGKVDKSI